VRPAEMSSLRSQFLLDVKAQLARGPHGWRSWAKDHLEFDEEQNESVLRESIAVVQYVSRGYDLRLCHALTIWGDQVATYSVRENVGKRLDKLVLRVQEFPVVTTPDRIAAAYWWSATQLVTLDVPPGKTREDHVILARMSEHWRDLSNDPAH
jgi:hypothetical protein